MYQKNMIYFELKRRPSTSDETRLQRNRLRLGAIPVYQDLNLLLCNSIPFTNRCQQEPFWKRRVLVVKTQRKWMRLRIKTSFHICIEDLSRIQCQADIFDHMTLFIGHLDEEHQTGTVAWTVFRLHKESNTNGCFCPIRSTNSRQKGK